MRVLTSLFITLFLFFPKFGVSQVPKALKGKWKGIVTIAQGKETLKGEILIGIGNWEAANAYQIEFSLSEFTDERKKYFKYVNNVVYKRDDDVGFYFSDGLPTDANLKLAKGNFEFDLLRTSSDSFFLGGRFTSEALEAYFSLVPLKEYRQFLSSSEGRAKIESWNETTANFYRKQLNTAGLKTHLTNPENKTKQTLTQDKSIRILENSIKLDADELYNFSDGYAVIKKGSSFALIDEKGMIKIPYNIYTFGYGKDCESGTFDYAAPINGTSWDIYGFKDGLLVAKDIKTNKYGVLNTKLEVVAPFIYDYLSGCSGHKVVEKLPIQDKKEYTVNLTKHKISLPFNDRKHPDNRYHYTLTKVASIEDQTLTGFCDKDGNIVIPAQYHLAGQFNEGMAAVAKYNEFGKIKWGFINTRGELVIDYKFSYQPSIFSEGLALVRPLTQDQFDYAYIDKTGKEVFYIRKHDKCNYKPVLFYKRNVSSPFLYDDYVHVQEASFFRDGIALWFLQCYDKGTELMVMEKTGEMYSFTQKLKENSQISSYTTRYDVVGNELKMTIRHGMDDAIVNLQGETVIRTSNNTGQTGTIHGLFDPISNLTLASIKKDNVSIIGYVNRNGEMIMTVKEKDLW